VRHATQGDLDRLEELLAGLRGLAQLRERKRGYFSRGSRAFLHFHEDDGDLYADVRLDDAFQRVRVTTGTEQASFLARVSQALGPGPGSAGLAAADAVQSPRSRRPMTAPSQAARTISSPPLTLTACAFRRTTGAEERVRSAR
jgi:hypothetical protein